MPTLILENGNISTSTANTYATIGYIDIYCENRGLSSWATASADSKGYAVLRAMDYIDSFSFKGVKTDGNQPLKFPRAGLYDEDGYLFYSTNTTTDGVWEDRGAIPKLLKYALARAAYEEKDDPEIFQPSLTSNIKKKKVDILETEYFVPGQPSQKINQIINNYLFGFLESSKNINIERT